MNRAIALVAVLAAVAAPRLSQCQERGATALGDELAGLGVSPRVLLIGAHPDDEDTQLIAWLAKGRRVETAYLSLTRGDGGQNLIGNELGPALGIIRTDELLAARRIDGGRQYFTRAYDFGFSKTAAETFKHWPRDSILQDIVTVIRAFRPTVIVSVWSGTPRDGHGHHQVSGILAREAFDASSDTVRFPRERTALFGPWQATKFYRGARFNPTGATVAMNVGEWDAVLGRTYADIAAESRSQHESQGQGNIAPLGARMDYARLEVSHAPGASVSDGSAVRERSLFDGIDTSWTRFATAALPSAARGALDSLPAALGAVRRSTDLAHPESMVAPLSTYLRLVEAARSGIDCRLTTQRFNGYPTECPGVLGDLQTFLDAQRERATRALLMAASVTVNADAQREVVAMGDVVPVNIEVFNGGRASVELVSARVASMYGSHRDTVLAARVPVRPDSVSSLSVPLGVEVLSMPWWLARPLVGDMFGFGRDGDGERMVAVGEDRVSFTTARVALRIDGVPVSVDLRPIVHRYADRAHGERRHPVAGVPGIAVLLEREIEYARANAPFDRMIRVNLQSAYAAAKQVTVSLTLPTGLRADSTNRTVTLAPGRGGDVYFRVRGGLAPGRHVIAAIAVSGTDTFRLGYVPIDYEHIRPERIYRSASVAIQAVDTRLPPGLRVGYIQGVGDNVAPMLEELGIPVTMLNPAALPQTDLSRLTTIVVGPRAYAADPALVANNAELLRWMRNGGTLVVQYGQAEMGQPGIMPYPLTAPRTTDRVTEEDSPVTVTDPKSRLLTFPNHITIDDFADWVQERALYMPVQFDPRYHTILSLHDTSDPPLASGVLSASFGKGTYVYTTLSLFRQLPAGNPGAARLMVNLLSAGHR